MSQVLLFPDPKPLDQRLGAEFFRTIPRQPGVYLMKDANDRVIYVGKAKDLRQRLNNYRLANPDRMPRRHLRLVREVVRIDLEFCSSDAEALLHEAALLRALKPKFNRAGVWPGKAKFLTWRATDTILELAVVETPETGWRQFGPLNGSARYLHQSFGRLLWLAVNLDFLASQLPFGWSRGDLPDVITIDCGGMVETVVTHLQNFFETEAAALFQWLDDRLVNRTGLFELALISADLESLQNFSLKRNGKNALLSPSGIASIATPVP